MKLLIKYPHFSRNKLFSRLPSSYKVCSGEQIVATLQCKGFLHRWGIAEAGNQRWKFEVRGLGLFFTKITIRSFGNNDFLGTFSLRPSFGGVVTRVFGGGGTLKLSSGQQFYFKPLGWWASDFVLLSEERKEIVKYWIDEYIKGPGEVEVSKEILSDPQWPLLMIFGLYVIYIYRKGFYMGLIPTPGSY